MAHPCSQRSFITAIFLFFNLLQRGVTQVWYPFDGTRGAWRFVGSASYIGGDTVRLTPPNFSQAGGVWYWNTFYVENWDATFDVRFTYNSNPPADGMCIILHNDPYVGNTGIGGAGGGFGYSGIQKSVAICIDTYSGTSPNWLGTGVYTSGNVVQTSPYLLQIPITDGNWYSFRVSYRRGTGYLNFNINGNGYTQDFSTYIGDILGGGLPGASRAWFGVTGATGGCYSAHDIRSFTWAPICPVPATPTDATVASLGGGSYRFTCKAGYYGAATTRTADPATCVYSGSNPVCTVCEVGYYCPGDGIRYLCPPGSYGSVAGRPSSACSGLCTAGYYCPAPGGATSPSTQVCGGTGNTYCGPGSSAPAVAAAGYFTGPLTVPASVREWQAPCPAGRSCSGGIVLKPVDFGSNCPSGAISITANENTPNVPISASLAVATPGYVGGVAYSLAFASSGSCAASQSVYFDTTALKLAVNAKPLDATFCTSPFVVTVTAARTADATLYDTCDVTVRVLQVGRQPVITDCAPRNVNERSIPGTTVGTPLQGTVSNTGTTLLWSVDDPFSQVYIDACTGSVRVRTVFYWNTLKSFIVPITLSNSGLPPVLTAKCNLTVTVNRVNQLPRLTSTDFFVNELSNVGVIVGQATAVDPDGDSVSRWTFTQVDSPNAFAVDYNTGMITVAQAVLDVILKSSYTYRLSFFDGYETTSDLISITLKPVPRPPVTFDQKREVYEGARAMTLVGVPLQASHPQGVAFSFVSISPSTVFGIFANGSVYVQIGATLDYNVASSYTLVFTVRDVNNLASTALLTVDVKEVNKAPVFCCGKQWNVGILEGARAGAAAGNRSNLLQAIALSAADPNSRDFLTFTVTAVQPAEAASLFFVNTLTGSISVSAGVPGGAITYEPSWNWPAPQTAQLSVSVLDNGVPQLWDNGTVSIQIMQVKPRLSAGTLQIPASAGAGMLLGVASAWTPYLNGIVSYDLAKNDLDLQGRPAFVMNSTGGLFLASFSGQPPTFNYNVKFRYNVTVRARDIYNNEATAIWDILLNHVNRPPTWSQTPPRMYAAALTSGSVGPPLNQYVFDPDVSLGLGESLLFRFKQGGAAVSGNTDDTFGINPQSGQVFVANNATPSFAYAQGAPVAPTYNITVEVVDAGINGPSYSAFVGITIQLTINQIPPSIAFMNWTVPEHSPAGYIVANITGSSVNPGYKLTYALQGAGPNAYSPFPFNITTEATGSFNRGVIRVTPAAAIEYWGQFRMYQATLTVTDNNPLTPLSTSTAVEIWVTWVSEPPYFNTVSKSPNSTTFVMDVTEHAAVNTNVTLTGTNNCILQGFTKDPWQRPLLRYSWVAGATNLFSIHPTTGCVTVAITAGDIQYPVQSQYNMTVEVRDSLGLRDRATVQIRVQDVNDPARFLGIFDVSNNNITSSGFRIHENATEGTMLGYVRAIDPDISPTAIALRWNDLLYGTKTVGNLAINLTTGAVTLRVPGSLDYWDITSFVITAGVQDGVLPPGISLVQYYDFKVNVLQVNTVAITGFSVPPGTLITEGLNISAIPGDSAKALAVTDCAFTTRGSTAVYIHGRGFGRTGRRLAAEGASAAATIVTATYGRTGTEYAAQNCTVITPNTLIRCQTVQGVGASHIWRITVDGWSATSTATTSYFAPKITAVLRAAAPALSTNRVEHALATQGEDIFVDCIDCGPLSTSVVLRYGRTVQEHKAPACTWVVAQKRLRCSTEAGIGAGLLFQLTISSQSSPIFNDTLVHYAPPTITSIMAPLMDTAGRKDTITIFGSNLGPGGTAEMVVRYSNNFTGVDDGTAVGYTAFNCSTSMTSPHIAATCMPAAGIGCGLVVIITVAGQTSEISRDTICYRPPIISDLQGANKDQGNTIGGQQIILSGMQFGPVTPLTSEGIPVGPTVPSARYGRLSGFQTGVGLYTAVNCFVAVAGTKIVCITAPGTGHDLFWQLIVGNQTSEVFTVVSTAYHAPIVSAYQPSLHPNTSGGELIEISGQQFGPAGTVIEAATYGVNGSEFIASNCTLVVPHTIIHCLTSVGAGSGLRWFVSIDGQRSVTPSTAYHAPEITSFAGIGMDAATDGGDTITIFGRYFSINKFLDFVTYGPAGVEFSALNCSVVIPHESIQCTVGPGVGRYLRWTVSVGGQHSEISSTHTAYAVPAVSIVSPTGIPTIGGTPMTLVGRNLALGYAGSSVSIIFNARMRLSPALQEVNTYLELLYEGSTDSLAHAAAMTNVTEWLRSCETFLPTRLSTRIDGSHEIGWVAPVGFGEGEVFVAVNGIISRPVKLSYAAPVILSVSPDRQFVPPGKLRLIIDGRHFCDGVGCGELLVNNVSVPAETWGHGTIVAIIDDLPANSPAASAQVIVGHQESNVKHFLKPVPSINALVAQGSWVGMLTTGGQLMWIAGVANIGTEPVNVTIGQWQCVNITRSVDNGKAPTDADAEFTLTCVTPPGVGADLAVIITSLGGPSRANSPVAFSYAAPVINDAVNMTSSISYTTGAARIPTLGSRVVVRGRHFGLPSLMAASQPPQLFLDDSVPLNITDLLQDRMTVDIPPGDGAHHYLRAIIAGQSSIAFFFDYKSPWISSVQPSHGPTIGGETITIYGGDFGFTRPQITLAGASCVLVEPYIPAAHHDAVRCKTPFGQGVNRSVVVSVSMQASSAAPLWSYDPPVLQHLSPPSGPTNGRLLGPLLSDGVHRGTGPRIVQLLAGYNLGRHGVLTFEPTPDGDPRATIVTIPAVDLVSWNDTAIQFFMPQGFGYGLQPTVYADQHNLPTAVRFDYDPPLVTAVLRQDKRPYECQTFEQCFSIGNITRCRTSYMGCFPTRGGFLVEIVGTSFGPQNLLTSATFVYVGGKLCSPVNDPAITAMQSHTTLICRASPGLGENVPVVVFVGGRANQPSNASVVSFDPPYINAIMPNQPDALGTQGLLIKGWNFGTEETPLLIKINDEDCKESQWLNDAGLRCQPPPQVVGSKNVSILVANRTEPYTFFDVEEALVYICLPGFYGMESEQCLVCPTGARCPGGERFVDSVNSTAGFWRSNVSISDQLATMCDAPRLQTRTACPIFRPCEPKESCVGDNLCAEGYEGERCAFCLKGKYYRMNGECVKCPDSQFALYIGLALVLLFCVGIAYYLNKKNVSLALISIGVDYMQVLSMFARSKVRWPAFLKQLLTYFQAFNLSIEITAPECLVPSLSFHVKWFAIEAVPLAAAVLLLLLHCGTYIYKKLCRNASKRQMFSHVAPLISTGIVMFRLLYLYLTRTSFDVLNCTPTEPPEFEDPLTKKNPIEYMSGMVEPGYVCWKVGSWQVFLFPFGLASLVMYSFALPGLALWHLRRNKEAVKADQILRAKGLGDDVLSNPRFFEFRRMWHKLYYHFMPGKWYWEFVIAARKLGIAGTSLAFRQVPSYQLAIALLILFSAYVVHVVHRPYMTHSKRPDVIAEHEKKAMYDPMHARIESDMKEAMKKNFRQRNKANVFQQAAMRKRTFVEDMLLNVFDANTVESILLACAILICLAGICFDSKRFEGDNLSIPRVKNEMLGFTLGCLVIIFVSLVYYAFVLMIEFSLVVCPESVPILMSCVQTTFCCGKVNAKNADLRHGKLSSKFAADRYSDGPSSDMVVNPVLLRSYAQQQAQQGDTDGFVDDNAVQQIVGLPSAAMWKAIQQSYGKMNKTITDLRTQVQASKKENEANSVMSGDLASQPMLRSARSRTQFKPRNTPGDSKMPDAINPLAAFKSKAIKDTKSNMSLRALRASVYNAGESADDHSPLSPLTQREARSEPSAHPSASPTHEPASP